MKEETIQKLADEVMAWDYLKTLPQELFGFMLQKDLLVVGDIYDIFSYSNAKRRSKFTVYYHDETKEYKVRVKIGMVEYCHCDFIMPDLASIELILQERMEYVLKDIAVFNREAVDSILVEKKILEWRYMDDWPETIEGFMRFITPNEPLKTINGSYIIFDYCDFTNDSSFAIYYNIFRDEFFGEAKIRNIPDVNYLFDSHELSELEAKIEQHLVQRLKQIREKIMVNESGDS